jgi:hypothetical protein
VTSRGRAFARGPHGRCRLRRAHSRRSSDRYRRGAGSSPRALSRARSGRAFPASDPARDSPGARPGSGQALSGKRPASGRRTRPRGLRSAPRRSRSSRRSGTGSCPPGAAPPRRLRAARSSACRRAAGSRAPAARSRSRRAPRLRSPAASRGRRAPTTCPSRALPSRRPRRPSTQYPTSKSSCPDGACTIRRDRTCAVPNPGAACGPENRMRPFYDSIVLPWIPSPRRAPRPDTQEPRSSRGRSGQQHGEQRPSRGTVEQKGTGMT